MKKNVFRLSFLFVLIVILLVAITIFIRDNPLSDIYVNQYESEIVHNFKNNCNYSAPHPKNLIDLT